MAEFIQVDISKLNLTQLGSLHIVLHATRQLDQAREVAALGEKISAKEFPRRVDEIRAALAQAGRFYEWDIP